MKWDKYQFLKFCNGLKLKFSSYYEYSFTFRAEKDGYKITALIGENADDIYKERICADEERDFN